MRTVVFPKIECEDVFSKAVSLITASEVHYIYRLLSNSEYVKGQWFLFDLRSMPNNLHQFKACHPNASEPVIIFGFTSKDDYVRLYDRYFVKGRVKIRKIYDILRASSHGLCPLCGIGTVTTLDHYLPKTRYPVFSIHARNLVPACEQCNKIKGSPIFDNESKMHLYAYGDDSKFYFEDWVSANIIQAHGVLHFDFYTSPPVGWSEIEKQRAVEHFRMFGLAKRYKTEASLLITSIIFNIREILKTKSHLAVKDYYLRIAEEVPPNSTYGVMYKAIANDINICKGLF